METLENEIEKVLMSSLIHKVSAAYHFDPTNKLHILTDKTNSTNEHTNNTNTPHDSTDNLLHTTNQTGNKPNHGSSKMFFSDKIHFMGILDKLAL